MNRRVRLVVLSIAVSIFTASHAMAQWTWTPETGRFVNLKSMPKETPELQVNHARSLMLEGRYRDALRQTEKFEKFYGSGEKADENQFLRGEIEFRDESYVDAAEEFQKVVTSYPDSPLYDDVIGMQYEIGDAMFDLGRETEAKRENTSALKFGFFRHRFGKRHYKRAIDVYAMVIDNQPFTDEAAQAQYKVGRCHFAREEYVESAFEYRRVLEDYAGSEWVADAGYGLARSYEEMSLEPSHDQAPSYLAIEAVEDFTVRYPADARVGPLNAMSDAMLEKIAEQRYRTAKFYERRQKIDSARVYYEITAGRFSGTRAAGKAQDWLEAHPHVERAAPSFIGSSFIR